MIIHMASSIIQLFLKMIVGLYIQILQRNITLIKIVILLPEKAQLQKAEEAKLQVKNKQIDNECLKLEQQLKQLEAEYQAIGSSVDKYASECAPKYA